MMMTMMMMMMMTTSDDDDDDSTCSDVFPVLADSKTSDVIIMTLEVLLGLGVTLVVTSTADLPLHSNTYMTMMMMMMMMIVIGDDDDST